MSSQWSLVGEGEIFLGLRSGGALRAVGQVKEFKLNVSEDVKEMRNYQGGGGLADQVSWISKVEASFNFLSLSAKNLAMALRGDESDLSSGTVSDQVHTAYPGGFIPLSGIGPSSVIVKYGESDTVLPTSEYIVKSAGIFILENSTHVSSSGTPVKISYTKSAGTIIQTLIKAADEYRVVFSGTNFARGGKPFSVDLFRVKFSPTKDLSFIAEDFAGLTLTASVLQDDTKTGADISTFCEIKMSEE